MHELITWMKTFYSQSGTRKSPTPVPLPLPAFQADFSKRKSYRLRDCQLAYKPGCWLMPPSRANPSSAAKQSCKPGRKRQESMPLKQWKSRSHVSIPLVLDVRFVTAAEEHRKKEKAVTKENKKQGNLRRPNHYRKRFCRVLGNIYLYCAYKLSASIWGERRTGFVNNKNRRKKRKLCKLFWERSRLKKKTSWLVSERLPLNYYRH